MMFAFRSSFIIILFYWQMKNSFSQSVIKCPPSKELLPCKCSLTSSKPTIQCDKLSSAKDLTSITSYLSGMSLEAFYLLGSSVEYLPVRAFANLSVTKIGIYDTSLSNFSSAQDSAFTGLEDVLVEITFRNCELTEQFKLQRLSTLTRLQTVDISDNTILALPDIWFERGRESLIEIQMKRNKIREVGSNAFSQLQNLVLLDLSENELSAIPRTSLPKPAKFLEYLYLSYNRFQTLPKDFLTDMPIIKRLFLDYNQLKVISSEIMEPLWQTNIYLNQVDLLGNDILCDVSLCWMTFYKTEIVTGSCADPDELRGRRLRTLWPWELNCNESYYHGDMKLPYRAKM